MMHIGEVVGTNITVGPDAVIIIGSRLGSDRSIRTDTR